MSEREAQVKVKVWGDYACFSRPEFKVERVSYPVITPSAARGVLEAIFWKPEFRYQISDIGVVKLGHSLSILRNEISERQSSKPIIVENKRQQRSSLILKDVAYLITGKIILRPHAKDHVSKYRCQFERRVENGQCHHTPYLGTREFFTKFEPPQARERVQINLQLPVGTMLFDIAFVPDPSRREMTFLRSGPDGQQRVVEGYAQALFFNAHVTDGMVHIPLSKYEELYRLEDDHA